MKEAMPKSGKKTARKYLVNVGLLFCTLFIFLLLVLAADLLAHAKFLNMAGLNYKGYRGLVVKKKQNNEIRLVMMGGSTVFGYGVKYNETVPARLEVELQKVLSASGAGKKATVVNLGYNSEGAYAFFYNLKDFSYLGYDYVIIYDGYNDLGVGNATVYRHSNPIFRIFGYMPTLPLVMKEKIMLMKNGGNLEDAYRGKKIVFEPTKKDIIKIAVLNSALEVYNNTENIMNRLNKVKDSDFDKEELKRDNWAWYKHYMKKSIDYALAQNKKVIVITQPYLSDSHVEQQHALREMLVSNYGDDKNVSYINLGDAISVKDKELVYDGVHLSIRGCQIMAASIAEKIGDKLN